MKKRMTLSSLKVTSFRTSRQLRGGFVSDSVPELEPPGRSDPPICVSAMHCSEIGCY